jgi:glycosyltransferase involved in cell wall biosynthesis
MTQNAEDLMSKPTVSVVVSAYNRPEMLSAALASLLAQSYKELEIIVQDDSPLDDCQKVVEALSDPRIRYTRNKPALGTSANLRAGYRKCTGKYFCTLNDDDLYHPDYVQTMVDALESNAAYSVAFSDHYIVGEDGDVDEKASDANSAAFGRDRLNKGSVPSPMEVALIIKSVPGMLALFRREAMDLSDFPDEVSSGYDYWLSYLAVRAGNPIYYEPRRLAYYRVHSGSQTLSFVDPQKRLRSLRYSEYMQKRFLADERLHSIHDSVRSQLSQIYLSFGSAEMRLDQRKLARNSFLRSLKVKRNASAMAGLTLSFLPKFLFERVMQMKAR